MRPVTREGVSAPPPPPGDSLPHVVPVVVHPENPAVHGEQRAVEAERHGAVEVLPLLLGHLEDDLGRVVDAPPLKREAG